MRQLLAIGLVMALSAVLVQSWRLSAAQERADVAEAQLSAVKRAAEIRRQTDEAQRQIEAEAAEMDKDLSTREGADAELSGYLRGAAGSLWP